MRDGAYAAMLVVVVVLILPLLSTAEYWLVVRLMKGIRPTLRACLSTFLVLCTMSAAGAWAVLTQPPWWMVPIGVLEAAILLVMLRKHLPPTWRRTWAAFGLFAVINGAVGIAVAWFALRPTFAEMLTFPTGNMLPAIHPGDRCLADRTATPRRWDIVTYLSPWDRKTTVVSRLVGMPGETIELRDGEVFIDGAILSRPAHLRSLNYEQGTPYGNGSKGRAVELREDECFVLGDNTGDSLDSRWYPEVPGHTRGAVPLSHIFAVVRFRYLPRERVGFLR
jgi:signal peptidase I